MHSLRLYGVDTGRAVCDNPGLNQQLFSVALTFGIALALCLLGRSIALRILDRRITDKLTFPHTFLNAIRFPSVLWCLAAALAITIRNAAPSPACRLGEEGNWSIHDHQHQSGGGSRLRPDDRGVWRAASACRSPSRAYRGRSTHVFVFSIGFLMLLPISNGYHSNPDCVRCWRFGSSSCIAGYVGELVCRYSYPD